jgi:hypothetical protein
MGLSGSNFPLNQSIEQTSKSSESTQERMFDLLNNRQSVPVPGAAVRATSARPDNETTNYDANGRLVVTRGCRS